MKSLREITLLFSHNKITDKGIEELALTLKSKDLLESIRVDFGKNRISDHGVIYFCEQLEGLEYLQHLDLTVSDNSKVNGRVVGKILKTDIFTSPTPLQSLTLGLKYLDVDDSNIQHLTTWLRTQAGLNLNSLSLFLTGNNLTARTADAIADAVAVTTIT